MARLQIIKTVTKENIILPTTNQRLFFPYAVAPQHSQSLILCHAPELVHNLASDQTLVSTAHLVQTLSGMQNSVLNHKEAKTERKKAL